MLARGKADNGEPGVRVAKGRHWRIPEIGELGAAGSARVDQPGHRPQSSEGSDDGSGLVMVVEKDMAALSRLCAAKSSG